MGDGARPFRTLQPFFDIMQDMRNPLVGVLLGAIFTAVVQSSAATLAIVIAIASQGLTPFGSRDRLDFWGKRRYLLNGVAGLAWQNGGSASSWSCPFAVQRTGRGDLDFFYSAVSRLGQIHLAGRNGPCKAPRVWRLRRNVRLQTRILFLVSQPRSF